MSAIPKCPGCGRGTYSKKFNSCTAEGCALNNSVRDRTPVPMRPRRTPRPERAPVKRAS